MFFEEYVTAFVLEQKHCSMSCLTHIEVNLEENSPLMNQRCRTMFFDKLHWLRGKIEDLVAIGILIPNANLFHERPAFVVPKKSIGKKRYRFVVDLRLLNQ